MFIEESSQNAIILYGAPAAGKSHSLATIFKLLPKNPKLRVFLLATDKNSIDGLVKGLKFHKIKLEPGQLFVNIITSTGKKKAFENELGALTKFQNQSFKDAAQMPDDAANKKNYTYYIDVLNGVKTYKGKDAVTGELKDFGNLSDLLPTDILIIDGLTPIIHGIWELMQGDRIISQIGDYQMVQKRLNTFAQSLTTSLSCHLILLGHADRTFNDLDKTERICLALDAGIALAGKWGGKFTDMIYCYTKEGLDPVTKKRGLVYKWSGLKPNVETIARNFPAQDDLEPDFSLYNFFNTK